jgi:hypothetical protein
MPVVSAVVHLTSFGLRVPVPEKPPPNWIVRNWLEATVPVKSKLILVMLAISSFTM